MHPARDLGDRRDLADHVQWRVAPESGVIDRREGRRRGLGKVSYKTVMRARLGLGKAS